MTNDEFNRVIGLTKMNPETATVRAMRLALVDGVPILRAAREIGINRSAVSVAIRRLRQVAELKNCPTCGHELMKGQQ